MRFWLLLILLGFPVLDLYLLVPLAGRLGWWLALWLAMSAVTGVVLIREARFSMLRQLAGALNGGDGLRALMDSGRMVLAGVLFIFPGVISDMFALALLLTMPRELPLATMRGPVVVEGSYRRERH